MKNKIVEITVAPYLAAMPMAKVTDYINLVRQLVWIADSVLIGTWMTMDRGEAEDEDSSMSDTSILCTRDRDHDLLIPIKANRLMIKSQCFRILATESVAHFTTLLCMMLVLIMPCKNL